jgi:cysteinyl-tRNA synthetase
VDDKIIERARQTGKDSTALAQENINAFYDDMGELGVLNADREPRATEHIDHMIQMIETLIQKAYAYRQDGDVFFSVEKLDDYGVLSNRRLEDMKAGSRIAVDKRKRHPMDFTLWKAAKPDEPQWPSPWGAGRPGWHMECSVMSNHYLGPTFDIHGGGQDLLFPHHENERAQSTAANGGEFARYWIHNGFVTVESEKMSKSLGNFITIRDALKDYPGEVIRLFLLSKHYRSPLDFVKKDVLNFQSGLIRIYRTLQRLETVMGPFENLDDGCQIGSLTGIQKGSFLEAFVHMMDDDLNTAGAIGLIFEKIKDMNRFMDDQGEKPDAAVIEQLKDERRQLFLASMPLGILQNNPGVFFDRMAGPTEIDSERVEAMIRERSEARARKDWSKADALREQLQEMGVVLEDGPGGTTWRLNV